MAFSYQYFYTVPTLHIWYTSTQHSLNSKNSMVLCRVKLIWQTNQSFLNVSVQQSDETQPYYLIWFVCSLQLPNCVLTVTWNQCWDDCRWAGLRTWGTFVGWRRKPASVNVLPPSATCTINPFQRPHFFVFEWNVVKGDFEKKIIPVFVWSQCQWSNFR